MLGVIVSVRGQMVLSRWCFEKNRCVVDGCYSSGGRCVRWAVRKLSCLRRDGSTGTDPELIASPRKRGSVR